MAGLCAASFDSFPALRLRFDETAAAFVPMLAPAREDFLRRFPDLPSLGSVYLLHSLGEMDGGTRTIGGTRYLVFGQAGLDGLPPRFGYYVGYLVARERARSHQLQALAHLAPADARAVVEDALAALAECPPRP